MSDAPEANAQAVELQPITVDRHGIFWFSVYWFRFKFRIGNGPRMHAFHGFQMSKALAATLSQNAETSEFAKRFNRKSKLIMYVSVLFSLPIGWAVGFECYHRVAKHTSFWAIAVSEYPEGCAVLVVLILLLFGGGQLLWIDLHRELYRLVDRYNAYVEEQTKAKAMPEPPAPPAAS